MHWVAATMKAVHCIDHEPTLIPVVVPRPELPRGHVRVRVHSCGLGMPDTLILKGRYQVRPALPFIPGSEVAGVVTEVAPDVLHIPVGARVAGVNYTFTGGLAEEALIPACLAVEVPARVRLEVAAALLVNYGTAYYALHQRASLQPGETVLVLGAAGGVGIAAVEIAKAAGARVLAAASSAAKLDIAGCHGADTGCNYSDPSFKDWLKAQGGIDVVVDPVGGAYSEQCLRALRPGGKLLVVGFAAGEIPRIPLNLPLLKDCSITGAFLGVQTRDRPETFVAMMKIVFDLYAARKLKPPLVEFECFTGVDSALRHIEDRRSIGKVVLRVAGTSEHDAAQAAATENPH
jgi:NADPH:quinone reductase-like Zn-dependent oxidoreductase